MPAWRPRHTFPQVVPTHITSPRRTGCDPFTVHLCLSLCPDLKERVALLCARPWATCTANKVQGPQADPQGWIISPISRPC